MRRRELLAMVCAGAVVGPPAALLVVAGALTGDSGKRIAELALANRLPSSGPFREAVEVGTLVSYGPDLLEIARQGAGYLDRVMKGAHPADIPVELPNR
jgi:putative ABC transport system substrate-binding protein